jgi:hypothetical protein
MVSPQVDQSFMQRIAQSPREGTGPNRKVSNRKAYESRVGQWYVRNSAKVGREYRLTLPTGAHIAAGKGKSDATTSRSTEVTFIPVFVIPVITA